MAYLYVKFRSKKYLIQVDPFFGHPLLLVNAAGVITVQFCAAELNRVSVQSTLGQNSKKLSINDLRNRDPNVKNP